jgi:methylglutaconyl-CoA hydratase
MNMTYDHLTTRREGAIEYLTLNRPEVRNALNQQMIAELRDWAARLRTAPLGEVRAAVVAGAGAAFCAGADTRWLSSTIAYTEDENLRDARELAAMFQELDELPLPIVGRVHGAAMGGGAGLVAVCDVAIAAADAVFAFPEVKLGIVPATISPFVLAKIGRSAARELFLTGARVTAGRAREIGMVHAVVEASELDSRVAACVREILTAGPAAVAAAKALVRDVWGRPAADAAPLTAAAIARSRVSPEGQEGLRAFLERRKPFWAE